MFHRKKIMESKHIRKKLKEKQLNKSISLLIKSPNYSKNNNGKKIVHYIIYQKHHIQFKHQSVNKGKMQAI